MIHFMNQAKLLIRRCEGLLIVPILLFVFGLSPAQAQQVSLELGSNNIGVNEQYTITLKVSDGRLREHGNFPEIDGFEKAGTSSSSSTNIVNGQVSSSQSVIQSYQPTREGSFNLAAFSMNVNDTQVTSPGAIITVGPARQRNASRNPFFDDDPFDQLFGKREPEEFVDVKDDAFLALTTSKDEVYQGEGFTATLAFYVSDRNQAPLQFYDLGKQLTDILKELKPASTWEENFNIENIAGTSVSLGGENYTQYKIYQATFYPLNLESITFPSVPLKMIKYKVAKNPSFFGRRRQEDFKEFYSKPKTVTVKDLPPHPLKETAAVGDYRLEEAISNQDITTGSSFDYTFKIVGEGNISAINKLTVTESDTLEIYPPSVQQNIERRNGQVRGSKAFAYYGVPEEPGTYRLSDYFRWVFFNPTTEKYDSLVSDITINVSGKSRQNEKISAQDVGSFYDKISNVDNHLTDRNRQEWLQLLANALILSMLALTAFVVFRK